MPSAQRWATLRIAAGTLLIATAMNAAIGHCTAELDGTRVEQLRVASVDRRVNAILSDLDRARLGEKEIPSADVRDAAEAEMKAIVHAEGRETTVPLTEAFDLCLAGIDREIAALHRGDGPKAMSESYDLRRPHDRLRDELNALDGRLQGRAQAATLATSLSNLAVLLLSAALVSYFAARHSRRTAALAELELQSHSSEARERRFGLLLEVEGATRDLSAPADALRRSTGLLGEFLAAQAWAFESVDRCGHNVDAEASGLPRLTPDDLAQLRAGRSRLDGSLLRTPLLQDGALRAVVSVRGEPGRVWRHDEIALAEEITAHLGAYLERAEAAEAVRRGEEHHRFVIDVSNDGVWEWHVADDTLVWSERMYGILGYAPEGFSPTYASHRALVHPDDLPLFDAAMASQAEGGEPFSLNLRFRQEDGGYLQVLAQGRTQRDAEGRPIRTVGTLTDLTEVLEAERAKQAVERHSRWTAALLEAQMDSSPDGIIIVDPKNVRILQNRRMAEVWGIPTDVIDDPDDDRQFGLILDLVKDRDAFTSIFQSLRPEETFRDEVELKSGVVLDRRAAPAVGPDGAVYGRIWTFRDITDRIRNERALREGEARLKGLMESMPQLVWRCRPDGYNFYFNGRWQEYTGQTAEASAGFGWKEAVHPDDEPQATADAPYEFECRLRSADGSYRWFLLRSIPILDAEGRIVERVGTGTDIDDLKLSEELLREAQEELEARVESRTRDLASATQAAERANAAKSEFLSRMSHELRTPLNAILGFGQILQRQIEGELQKESVHYILKGGRHLLGLINEVLDLSRVETGNAELSIEPVPLAEVLDESLAMVRTAAAERGLTLDEGIGELDGLHVVADRQRLKQVLINLLSNAVKYNRPEGRVAVKVAERDGRVRIAVADTGHGISEEGLAKLFTPFERLNAAPGIEGTGLGLFLTQRLVGAMGGKLGVESVVGEGTTFAVELELARPPAEGVAPTVSLEVVEGGEPKGEISVLCVEDNSSNLRLMEMVFAHRPNVRLSSAGEGMAGFRMARETAPDLILLDGNLPDVDGIEVLTRLKRSGATSAIPVIVISADATSGRAEEALRLGAEAYLTKPLNVDRFLQTFDHALLSREGEPRLPQAA